MQEKRLVPAKLKLRKFPQQGRIYARFNEDALAEMDVRIVVFVFHCWSDILLHESYKSTP